MPRKQHVHKYFRQHTQSFSLWRCALDECNHYMPAHLTETVVGRTSICWSCGIRFRLDEDNMKLDKPVCASCNEIHEHIASTSTRTEPKTEVSESKPKERGDVPYCVKCGLNPQRVTAQNTGDGLCMSCWAKVLGIS